MTKAFVNAEETITRVVGKRSQAPDALSTKTSSKANSVAWQRSFDGVRVPRGVHRFKTSSHRRRFDSIRLGWRSRPPDRLVMRKRP